MSVGAMRRGSSPDAVHVSTASVVKPPSSKRSFGSSFLYTYVLGTMLTYPSRAFAKAYFLHVLLWAQVKGQTPSPFARLSPEPFFVSESGKFTWPAGESTGTFSEGAKMNISWETTYPAINLWLITNQSWAQPSSSFDTQVTKKEAFLDCQQRIPVPDQSYGPSHAAKTALNLSCFAQ